MTVYCVAQAKNINVEGLARYREHSRAALERHGGSVLVSSKDLTMIEGDGGMCDVVALLEFPDKEAVFAWRNDETLAPVHDLRTRSGVWSIRLLE